MSNLKATKRENSSSGSNNKLRAKGYIPAILYGGSNPSLKLSIEEKLLNKVFNSESFLSTIIELNIDGKTEKVIPRDISYHVLSDKLIHIDFMRVAKGSKIILHFNFFVSLLTESEYFFRLIGLSFSLYRIPNPPPKSKNLRSSLSSFIKLDITFNIFL